MSNNSSIEWTEATWNPVSGCTKISPGCKHCYAERMAHRLQAMGQPNYKEGFSLSLHENSLDLPLKWKKPQKIFVNSMSDLFHEMVPVEFINKVFFIMKQARWHEFQILTKRSEILLQLDSQLDWNANIWMGVSVENQDYTYRIDHLRQTHAKIKFVSIEPMLGPIHELDLEGVDWVIVGGESGPGARKMNFNWATEIRDHCRIENVPFFFKQWGGVNRKRTGRELDGKTWDEIPLPQRNLSGISVSV